MEGTKAQRCFGIGGYLVDEDCDGANEVVMKGSYNVDFLPLSYG